MLFAKENLKIEVLDILKEDLKYFYDLRNLKKDQIKAFIKGYYLRISFNDIIYYSLYDLSFNL